MGGSIFVLVFKERERWDWSSSEGGLHQRRSVGNLIMPNWTHLTISVSTASLPNGPLFVYVRMRLLAFIAHRILGICLPVSVSITLTIRLPCLFTSPSVCLLVMYIGHVNKESDFLK